MAKPDKLSQLELLERRKRIPQKTQEILRKMISRRYAELCSPSPGGNRQARRFTKPYEPEIWLDTNRDKIGIDQTMIGIGIWRYLHPGWFESYMRQDPAIRRGIVIQLALQLR